MATVSNTGTSILGINSGLDTGAIVEKLVSLNHRPTEVVMAKKDIEQQKLSAFQELKSKLQTFKSIVSTLNRESKFLSVSGKFSNSNTSSTTEVVQISTTSSATSGVISFAVNALAKEGKVASEAVSSTSSTIPKGVLELTVGGVTTQITIDSSNNTLDGLRLAINNSGVNVKATFLNTGDATNPYRLVVAGNSTGAVNTVSAQIVQASIGAGFTPVFSFTQTQAAQDASLTVDGVAVTKSSNTVTDVIAGTTLTLKSTGTGTITLQSDVQAIKDKVTSFVNGYNDLMKFLNGELFLDKESKNTGVLFGNYTVQSIQQTLRSTVSNAVTGVSGDFKYLAQVGVSTASDGLLSLDEGKLANAINQNVGNLSQLFASKGTTSNTNVTFVGFTDKSLAGTYDVRVSNGVPQLRVFGTGNFVDAVGAGTFFSGATGTSMEGLSFRIGTLTDDSYGTITLTTGVAEVLSRAMANLTDTSRNGPLAAELSTATKSITDYDTTIKDQETRLQLFQDNLRSKFANLEVVVGRLNSQKDAFTNSLAGLQAAFKN